MIRRVFRGPVGDDYGDTNEVEFSENLDDAELVTSEVDGESRRFKTDGVEKLHAPVLDIDFPAALVPSTTPGKFHLYLDVEIPESKYFALLESLAEAGVIEEGYAGASLDRGYTAVRLPWVEKPEEVTVTVEDPKVPSLNDLLPKDPIQVSSSDDDVRVV